MGGQWGAEDVLIAGTVAIAVIDVLASGACLPAIRAKHPEALVLRRGAHPKRESKMPRYRFRIPYFKRHIRQIINEPHPIFEIFYLSRAGINGDTYEGVVVAASEEQARRLIREHIGSGCERLPSGTEMYEIPVS